MTELVPILNRLIDIGIVILIVIGVFFVTMLAGVVALVIHTLRYWGK